MLTKTSLWILEDAQDQTISKIRISIEMLLPTVYYTYKYAIVCACVCVWASTSNLIGSFDQYLGRCWAARLANWPDSCMQQRKKRSISGRLILHIFPWYTNSHVWFCYSYNIAICTSSSRKTHRNGVFGWLLLHIFAIMNATSRTCIFNQFTFKWSAWIFEYWW